MELEPLIDAAKIAQHLHCSTRHVVDRISKRVGFPKPINKKPMLWRLKDVNEWLQKAQ